MASMADDLEKAVKRSINYIEDPRSCRLCGYFQRGPSGLYGIGSETICALFHETLGSMEADENGCCKFFEKRQA